MGKVISIEIVDSNSGELTTRIKKKGNKNFSKPIVLKGKG